MVARITTGKSIRAMLHYNENKVTEGEATLIMASGFAGDIEQIKLHHKLNRFQHLLDLKPSVKTNAVHISLNFHSGEKINGEKLQQIAASYMEKIGFGEQPFLVYRHHDAAHTHIHIVTTNIDRTAERIDLHDIGRLRSEPARKAIEEEFRLVKAQSKELKQHPGIKKVEAQKVAYGRLPTKRAISNVLTAVLRDYRFTSLAEYNAVLKCFNVMAFRGGEHTEMFAKKGLMYTVIEDGRPIGMPIKASAFYTKPTLRNLEELYEKKQQQRKPHREAVKERIDGIFQSYYTISQNRFVQEAKLRGLEVTFRQNEKGQVFGVTFVDHQSRCVFNGSDLGKAYSAKGLGERLSAHTRSRNPSLQQSRGSSVADELMRENSPSQHAQPSFLELALAKTQSEQGIGVPKRKKRRKQQQELTQ
ncbi:relaxase/mobilization nuclease domain-containing protein [Nubsella zeaxanthinifaciens]|uniref:relaxase/mobilization nuclease domain-containing protein n=1 Tax=Nubsella zeaxanthinifaciens TaxID=392412 RepID=UPI003CFFD2D0